MLIKGLLSSILALGLLLGASFNKSSEVNDEQTVYSFINTQLVPATVLLYSGEEKSFRCTASDILNVEDSYVFATAAHCISGSKVFYISPNVKDPRVYYPATLMAYGDLRKDQDFAIFIVRAPAGTFTVVPLGHSPTQRGEPIFAISAPAEVGLAYLRGYVEIPEIQRTIIMWSNGVADDWKGDVLVNMAGTQGGSSGSLVVCQDQMKVCGILVGVNGASMIVQPIDKFNKWFQDVLEGKVDPMPKMIPPDMYQLFFEY